ncbi:MAG TPA: hypothetical protein VGO64_03335 [Candidatus Limnocylindrales bacterium]|nr:hypothetical protein [Candidatus Limnocylindrales bacterium]
MTAQPDPITATHSTLHPDAPPGKEAKYARLERERRFLFASRPSGAIVRRVLIEDRYVLGTRLRLRRVTDLDAPISPTFRLTQKIPAAAGGPGLITTLYLSAREYRALAELPARAVRKVRSSIPPLGVDEFEGPLSGLVLGEAEFDDSDAELAFEQPAGTVAEVTADARFTGGALASMEAGQIEHLLREFRLGE